MYQRKLISGLRTACQNELVPDVYNSADQNTFLSCSVKSNPRFKTSTLRKNRLHFNASQRGMAYIWGGGGGLLKPDVSFLFADRWVCNWGRLTGEGWGLQAYVYGMLLLYKYLP